MTMSPTLEDPRYERLRTLLVESRKRKKLTQIDLGARLGKDQVWVSRYELGRRQLDAVELMDVAKAIGVDPCSLLRKIER
jgi:transcriptional regulator with XRE-family HTH domain